MSITKPPLTEIWAHSAPSGPTGIEDPGGLKSAGWSGTSACPPFSWMNWILNKCDAASRYLLARGIPDYDVNETYSVGDRIQGVDGRTYVCIVASTGDGSGSNGPNQAPTNWTRWARGLPIYFSANGYEVGDQVFAPSNGRSYICLIAHGSGSPHEPSASPTYWKLWGHTDAEVVSLVRSNGNMSILASSTGMSLTAGNVSDITDLRLGYPEYETILRDFSFTLANIPSSPGYVDVTLGSPLAFLTGVNNVQVTAAVVTTTAPYGEVMSQNVVRISCQASSGPYATAYVRLLGY